MKLIKISKEISLPLDVVTQTVAILAKRRVGKSYTMRRVAEQLLDANQQVVIVDPKKYLEANNKSDTEIKPVPKGAGLVRAIEANSVVPVVSEDMKLSGPQQKILDTLAWLDAIGIMKGNRTIVAFLADQSPRSSGYSNNVTILKTKGFLDYPNQGELSLTDKGQYVAQYPDVKLTNETVHKKIFEKLSKPQASMLKILIENYPEPVEKPCLAELSNQSPTSSGFSNNVTVLKSFGLASYPEQGMVQAAPFLFL